MVDLDGLLEAAVAADVAPGLAAGALTPSGQLLTGSVGVRGVEAASPLTRDTLFMIASCTKPITSVAAMQLVENGVLHLDDPVGALLPALAKPQVLLGFDDAGDAILRPAKKEITLQHLLTHTSGLAYDFTSATLTKYLQGKGTSLAQMTIPDIPLMFDPGDGWIYGIGLDWVASLIEKATGERFDRYCKRHLFEPLGMADSTFFPASEVGRAKASVHVRSPEGKVFVENPFAMPPEHHFWMGGAGLYCTIDDYMKFLKALALGGAPLLQPETFQLMMENHVGDYDAGAIASADPNMSHDFNPLKGVTRRHSLAGVINMEAVQGGRSAGSISWAGITNCYYWVDPSSQVAGALFSQVLPFADERILDTFEKIERAVYEGDS